MGNAENDRLKVLTNMIVAWRDASVDGMHSMIEPATHVTVTPRRKRLC